MRHLTLLLLVIFLVISPPSHSKKTIRTVAGLPPFKGEGTLAINAIFNRVSGVFGTVNNEIFISDSFNYVIRKVDKNGIVSTVAGTPGVRSTNVNSQTTINKLDTIFVYSNSEILFYENFVIKRAFTNGTIKIIAGGNGNDGGSSSPDETLATSAQLGLISSVFGSPTSAEVYFSEENSHTVRKISLNGTLVTVAGMLNQHGYSGDQQLATNALLTTPCGIFITDSNSLFIADAGNNAVRRVFPNGTITTVASSIYRKGAALLNTIYPINISASKDEKELYISDKYTCLIQKVILENNTVVNVVGTGVCGYNGNNIPATSATIGYVKQLYISPKNELYIAELSNNIVRKVTTEGMIVLVAGINLQAPELDPQIKLLQLNSPTSVYVTEQQDMYIADSGNFVIKKVDRKGKVTIVAGMINRVGSFEHNVLATNTTLSWISALIMNEQTNELYFSSSDGKIGQINITSGMIYVVASGLGSTDKILSLTSTGEVIVANYGGSYLYKVSTKNNSIEVLAGNTATTYTCSGDSIANATFSFIAGVYISQQNDDEIFVFDRQCNGANTIRRIFLKNGTISTVTTLQTNFNAFAMNRQNDVYLLSSDGAALYRLFLSNSSFERVAGIPYTYSFSGDNSDPIEATFNSPKSFYITEHSIFIVDTWNDIIRQIAPLCSNYSFDSIIIPLESNFSDNVIVLHSQSNRLCISSEKEFFDLEYLPIITIHTKSNNMELASASLTEWNQQFVLPTSSLHSQQLDMVSIVINNCNEKGSIMEQCKYLIEYGVIPTSQMLFVASVTSATFVHHFTTSKLVSTCVIQLEFVTNDTKAKKEVLISSTMGSTEITGLLPSTWYQVNIQTTVTYTNSLQFKSKPITKTLQTQIGIYPSASVQSMELSVFNQEIIITWDSIPQQNRGNPLPSRLELLIMINLQTVEQVEISPYYVISNSPSSYSYSFSQRNVEYGFKVRACSEIGCSNYSSPVFITIEKSYSLQNSLIPSIVISLLVVICLIFCILFIIIVFIIVIIIVKKNRISNNSDNEIEMISDLLISKELYINQSKLDLAHSKLIGSGASGSVITASYFNMQVAIKLIPKTNSLVSGDANIMDDFYNELQFLNTNAQHLNIIRFFGVYENLENNHLGLVMEYCKNGSIASYISTTVLSFAQKIEFIKGIANGMQYLHFHNIAHRDLKCENVLLDAFLTPKIIDFGFSRVVSNESNQSLNLTMNVGTAAYCAPEVIQLQVHPSQLSNSINTTPNPSSISPSLASTHLAYDKKCDIYSFAICMWVIYFQNKNPYGNDTNTNQILYYISTNPNFRPKIETVPEDEAWYIDLMKKCWASDSELRPSFEQICATLSIKRD